MKAKRLLFPVMAICLASGVKAQFHDSADDIYYYVEYKDGNFVNNGKVFILNFDGKKAAELQRYMDGENIQSVKDHLQSNPSYYEEKVETTEYRLIFDSSSSRGTIYKWESLGNGLSSGLKTSYTYIFTDDRNMMTWIRKGYYMNIASEMKKLFKRVDKSFFKVGRSRTPSGTLHE